MNPDALRALVDSDVASFGPLSEDWTAIDSCGSRRVRDEVESRFRLGRSYKGTDGDRDTAPNVPG
jgi:hypothetical protein